MKLSFLVISGLALVGCKDGSSKKDGDPKVAAPTTPSNPSNPSNPEPAKPGSGDKPTTPAAGKATTPEAKLKRYNECWDAFNTGKDEVFSGCFSADSVREQVDSVPEAQAQGPEKILEMAKQQKAAFPDLKVTPQIVVVSGTEIAAILHVTGTNTGDASGMKPTKQKIGIFEAQLATMHDDGTLSRDSFYIDQLTVFHQLGLLENDQSPNTIEKGMGALKALTSSPEITNANRAIVEKNLEAINKKDVKALEALAADDIKLTRHGDRQKVEGKKAYLKWIKDTLASTSDGKVEVKGIWAAGDFVAVADTFTGSPAKDIPGTKGTKGKRIETRVAQFFQIVDGKIKQQHMFSNHLKTAVQLGLVDPDQLMKMLSAAAEEGKAPGK